MCDKLHVGHTLISVLHWLSRCYCPLLETWSWCNWTVSRWTTNKTSSCILRKHSEILTCLMWKPPKMRSATYFSLLATIKLNNLLWKSSCGAADSLLKLPDEHPELCFVPAGSRVGAGSLAPFWEGHVPWLLLQERAVEETEVAELGQRGELSSFLSVCMF